MENKDYVIVNITSTYNPSYSPTYTPTYSTSSSSSPTYSASTGSSPSYNTRTSTSPSPTYSISSNPSPSYNISSSPSPTYSTSSSPTYITNFIQIPNSSQNCKRRNRPKPLFNQTTQPSINLENNVNELHINIGNYDTNYLQDDYNISNKQTLSRRLKNYIGFKLANDDDNEEYINV